MTVTWQLKHHQEQNPLERDDMKILYSVHTNFTYLRFSQHGQRVHGKCESGYFVKPLLNSFQLDYVTR